MNFISGELWGLSWLGPQNAGPGTQALLEGIAIGECDPGAGVRSKMEKQGGWCHGCLLIPLGPSTWPCEWVTEPLAEAMQGKHCSISSHLHWPPPAL